VTIASGSPPAAASVVAERRAQKLAPRQQAPVGVEQRAEHLELGERQRQRLVAGGGGARARVDRDRAVAQHLAGALRRPDAA
jgi:hypothetical protein